MQRPQIIKKVQDLPWPSFARKPLFLACALFVLLLALVAGGYQLFFHEPPAAPTTAITPDSAFIVIVSHDNKVETIPSHSQTVGQLLEKLDIKLHTGDVVEPDKSTKIEQDDFRINVYRAKPVTVVNGNQRTFAFSAAATPRSIAEQVGVNLFPEDGATAEPVTNFLKQRAIAETVVVNRSFPVKLNLYGSKIEVRTHAKTVGDLLRDKGLIVANGDQVLPALDTPLTKGSSVVVARQGAKLKSVVKAIKMPVKTIHDDDLAYGVRAVRQKGQPGKQAVIYSIDKKTHEKKVLQTITLQTPVEQIVVVGTNLSGTLGDIVRAGIDPSDYRYVDYIVSHEGGWDGVTKYNYSGSGAYGICQALPGSKMASAGSDWRTNPITQLKWCDSYAVGHYGSWRSAYYFWVSHGWW